MDMNWRVSIAAVAALIALGETAKAGIWEAGPGSAGPAQSNGTVTCLFFNAAVSTAASIDSREIWNSAGGREVISGDSCGNPLPQQKFCQYVARTSDNFSYTCRAVISGVEENIRGTMNIYSETGQLLLSIEMKRK
jgi:hypothetical protein